MKITVVDYVDARYSGKTFDRIIERLPKDVDLSNVDDYIEDILDDLMREDARNEIDITLDDSEYEDRLPGGYSRALPGDGVETFDD